MKSHRNLLAALAFIAGAFASVAHAQTPIHTLDYTPDNKAEMYRDSLRYQNYAFENNHVLYTNVWRPSNAAGSRVVNHRLMPLGLTVNVFDRISRHWSVSYDIKGELSEDSIYYDPRLRYDFIKAYPHIQYKPKDLYVWQGKNKHLRSQWDFGAESSNWGANQFNAIWEIRLARYDQKNEMIAGTNFIIQIEVMQSRYGYVPPPNKVISGYAWTTEKFTAFDVPIYKYVLSGAGVSWNSSRSIELDLFAFIQDSSTFVDAPKAKDGAWTDRFSWDARVYEVNAGVELGLGTKSKFWTSRYWAKAWDK